MNKPFFQKHRLSSYVQLTTILASIIAIVMAFVNINSINTEKRNNEIQINLLRQQIDYTANKDITNKSLEAVEKIETTMNYIVEHNKINCNRYSITDQVKDLRKSIYLSLYLANNLKSNSLDINILAPVITTYSLEKSYRTACNYAEECALKDNLTYWELSELIFLTRLVLSNLTTLRKFDLDIQIAEFIIPMMPLPSEYQLQDIPEKYLHRNIMTTYNSLLTNLREKTQQ